MDAPVSKDSPRPEAATDRALREWYALYQHFVAHLDPQGKRVYSHWNLAEFSRWWLALDARSRQLCEQDFLLGYEAVLLAAQQEVALAIKAHQTPSRDVPLLRDG